MGIGVPPVTVMVTGMDIIMAIITDTIMVMLQGMPGDVTIPIIFIEVTMVISGMVFQHDGKVWAIKGPYRQPIKNEAIRI